MSEKLPCIVPVKVRVPSFTKTVDAMPLSSAGCNGVTMYSKSETVSCSTGSPFGPVSRSRTVMDTSASEGNTIGVSSSAHDDR